MHDQRMWEKQTYLLKFIHIQAKHNHDKLQKDVCKSIYMSKKYDTIKYHLFILAVSTLYIDTTAALGPQNYVWPLPSSSVV
jgi:hypothetical protein